MSKPQRDWFSIAEVSINLDVPVPTLTRWVNTGRVWAELAGKGTYLIHASEIEAMQRNGNRPTTVRRYKRQTVAA